MPLYLYGPVLQVVEGPALAASDGCCCINQSTDCNVICPTNRAFFDCFGTGSWELNTDECQAGFVPSSASCPECPNVLGDVTQCCSCCVENGAP